MAERPTLLSILTKPASRDTSWFDARMVTASTETFIRDVPIQPSGMGSENIKLATANPRRIAIVFACNKDMTTPTYFGPWSDPLNFSMGSISIGQYARFTTFELPGLIGNEWYCTSVFAVSIRVVELLRIEGKANV